MNRVEEHIVISRAADEIRQLLTYEESDWLVPFLRIAAHSGEQAGAELRARLRPQPEVRAEGARTIIIKLGIPSMLLDGGTVGIPIRWEASGYRSFFPLFEGMLVLKAVDAEQTDISLEGDYASPAAVTGDLDDRLVAHHAAQTAFKDLLGNLRTAMESESSRKELVEGSG